MSNSFMEVLTAILPVTGMIFVGVFLKKTQWISRKGIDDIKFLVSRILLAVGYDFDLHLEKIKEVQCRPILRTRKAAHMSPQPIPST